MRLRPRLIVPGSLLRRAAISKIRENSPLLKLLDTIPDDIFDLVRGFEQPIAPTGFLGQDNPEKNGRVSAPVFSQDISQTHNVGSERRPQIVDSLIQLSLMYIRPSDRHCFIIVAGSVNENVDPSPTRESAQMRPPYCSTIRWQIASPRPVLRLPSDPDQRRHAVPTVLESVRNQVLEHLQYLGIHRQHRRERGDLNSCVRFVNRCPAEFHGLPRNPLRIDRVLVRGCLDHPGIFQQVVNQAVDSLHAVAHESGEFIDFRRPAGSYRA